MAPRPEGEPIILDPFPKGYVRQYYPPCKHKDCTEKSYVKGFCMHHYQLNRRMRLKKKEGSIE